MRLAMIGSSPEMELAITLSTKCWPSIPQSHRMQSARLGERGRPPQQPLSGNRIDPIAS